MASSAAARPERILDTVFLDRDGTINRKAPDGEYIRRWEEFEFLPGARTAIAELGAAGLRIVVVTNQRGIALGRMSEADLVEIHRRMHTDIRAAGGALDAVLFCPHDEGECDCRKPRAGMFLDAQRMFPEIDFRRSAVIGDSWRDMEAARGIGAKRVAVGSTGAEADLSAPSLAGCVALLTTPPQTGVDLGGQ